MSEEAIPRGERDRGLDALRAVACLLVFVFHVDAETGLAGGWLRGGGVAGVYTFFVLSGFLLYRPFLRGPVPLKGYAIRRVARIYPAYLFALIGLSLITGAQTFWQHPLQYLLFIQNADSTLFQGFVGVTWTLEMEVGFYIALPFLAMAVQGRPRRIAALAIPSLLAWLVIEATIGSTPNVTLFPLYGWMFAAGMLLAIAIERGWRPASRRTLIAGWALIAGAMFISGPLGRADNAFQYAVMIGLTEAGAVLVAGYLVVRRLAPWLAPLAIFGGALSYAFYLWHADVIGWVAGTDASPLGVAAIAFLVTLPIATFSWLLFEKPAIEIARRGRSLGQWRSSRPTTDVTMAATTGEP